MHRHPAFFSWSHCQYVRVDQSDNSECLKRCLVDMYLMLATFFRYVHDTIYPIK